MVAHRPSQPSPSRAHDEPILDSLANAYERLGRLERQLEHCQRLATIGTLSAGVAHEINNLLTPVLGYAHLALKQTHDPKAISKALDRIILGVESTARIVHAILGFAAPNLASTDVANVRTAIDAAMTCLARDPQKDAIRLSIDVNDEAVVRMNSLALQQVVLNLVLNACRAMRPRGGELLIQVASGSEGSTLITIADTGPGIPNDVLAGVFMPFPGAHPRVPTSGPTPPEPSTGGGTGLGLFVCRQLVQAAGGTITAMNGPNGAIFTIALQTAIETSKKTA